MAQATKTRGSSLTNNDSTSQTEDVERYRRAHAIAVANSEGDTDTEDLRIAMQDYRALFEEQNRAARACKRECVGDRLDAFCVGDGMPSTIEDA